MLMITQLKIKEASEMKEPNFLEVETIEDANKIDETKYRWSERMSATVGKFIFVKRIR